MTFDPTKPVQTRDGCKARIICTDRAGTDFSIVALILGSSGRDFIETFTCQGCYSSSGLSGNDLINIPEQPTFRPWKLTEVPYGGIARLKNGTRMLITPNNDWTTDATLINWVWCWPHEQFTNVWRPCGVEVKS